MHTRWSCGCSRGASCLVEHFGRDALDGYNRAILAGLARVHGHNDILSGGDLAEHRVLRWRRSVKEIQKRVVNCVNKKLRSTGVRLACVGHGEGEGLVGQLRATGVSELIRDGAASVTLDGFVAAGISRIGVGSACEVDGSGCMGEVCVSTMTHMYIHTQTHIINI